MDLHRPTRPNGFLSRFVRDQRGVSAIIFALILPVLFGFVGVSVEVGLWYSKKRNLQAAADAGAMAAVRVLIASGTWTDAETAAIAFAVHNGAVAANVDPNKPPTSGTYTNVVTYPYAVEVIVTESQTLMFSAVFLSTAVTVTARAVANGGEGDEACLIALNPTINDAVEVTGSADVSLNGCGVAVNSSSSDALTVSGSGYFSAPSAMIVGNYDADAADFVVPTKLTGASPVTDPYASLDIGTPGACVAGNTSQAIGPAATVTLAATTTYCDGLDLRGTLNLNGNTLYIKGGTFNINATANLTGTGTVILTGTTGDYATISINGSATVDITAPTSGTFKGLAIVQDPDAPAGNDNTINGNASTAITGAIYFPSGDVTYSGNSSVAATGCTRIIAYTVHFSGNNNLYNNCSGYDYSWPSSSLIAALVE